jgi:putative ATP-dependent endonuclease of OLD family
VKVDSIEIRNFRAFVDFDLSVGGESLFVVSENGAGKTSLLAAIAKALGKDRSVTLSDFADKTQPIEIIVTLSGFDASDSATFPKELSFQGPPTLRIGMHAVWDPVEGEPDVTVGFPDKGWKAASRQQRDALPMLWLPAYRDPTRTLSLVGARTILGQLVSELNLTPPLDTASDEVEAALDKLAATPDLQALLKAARDSLASIIPSVQPDAFSLETLAADTWELLQQFQLAVAHASPPLPVARQSAGLAQLAVFVFALQLLSKLPKAVLLVDEPEISLHPQAQRALVSSIKSTPNQFLLSTHSSNVLDRADLRFVVRLHRGVTGVAAARPILTPVDAERLARFFNPQTAEGCFARKVVLVEGPSDRATLLRLAQRVGKNTDGLGVTILSLDGGSTISAFLRLFGPNALGLELIGLCDADKEPRWLKDLNQNGIPVTDRATMAAKGFFVADPDLEGIFVSALGVPTVEAIIQAEGEQPAYQKFAADPKNASLTKPEVLRKFLHRENIRWAVPLVDALNPAALPGVLNDLVTKL